MLFCFVLYSTYIIFAVVFQMPMRNRALFLCPFRNLINIRQYEDKIYQPTFLCMSGDAAYAAVHDRLCMGRPQRQVRHESLVQLRKFLPDVDDF